MTSKELDTLWKWLRIIGGIMIVIMLVLLGYQIYVI